VSNFIAAIMIIRNRFLVVLSFLLMNAYISSAQQKHALIIAVGDYPKEGRWTKISSTSDIPLIKDVLSAQGFSDDHIAIIKDQAATKEGIANAFKKLIEQVKAGDIVVIHFSGHGQQIKDNNHEEMDGYDESIIPYNAQRVYQKGVYEGENHFRDDELNQILSQLRVKLGKKGNVLVILDACHSGTGTRGNANARGTSEKFAEEGYVVDAQTSNSADGFTSENIDKADLASMVLISGASADQLNYEYKDKDGSSYGSLSYAISKSLKNAKSDYSYRALFEDIKREMSKIAPHQSPQIEGMVDQRLFGGEIVEQKPFFTAGEWVEDKLIAMNVGTLAGLTNQTIVGFYPANTIDPDKATPIVTGTVQNASLLECDIITDMPVTKEIAASSWLFIKQVSLGNNITSVNLSKVKANKTLYTNLLKSIGEVSTLKVMDSAADIYVELKKDNSVSVYTKDDQSITELPLAGSELNVTVASIVKSMKTYVRGNMIRALEMQDEKMNVVFELVPITVKKVGRQYVEDTRLSVNDKTVGGQVIFKDGDVFKVKITNKGTSDCFFQIIDIKPNNEIDILVPGNNETPAEYKIKAQASIELNQLFVFQEPFGNEMFKLVATKEPINISSIVYTRGSATSSGNPLEQIIQESYSQTRAASLTAPPKSANISSIVVTVAVK
jgi:hypothetical protein